MCLRELCTQRKPEPSENGILSPNTISCLLQYCNKDKHQSQILGLMMSNVDLGYLYLSTLNIFTQARLML